jgi:adenosylmethionine-8-amino-7-oxononanoate aminotransferase
MADSAVWPPYTPLKTATQLEVIKTHASTITLADGRNLIDGIASWWTACHGYNHPHIRAAVEHQLQTFPHVMFGGLGHAPARRLAQRLIAKLPGDFARVFFSDSGSVAVEVALKMAAQYWLNQGDTNRHRVLAFKGAYHGDTFATMAVCDPEEGMHALFAPHLHRHDIIDLPTTPATTAAFHAHLASHAPNLTAILVEPLVQGAGGMVFHPPASLRILREAADLHHLPLIFDEIFTGFGRTGTMFACEQAGVAPDIITLSKALTGGTLPLAATIASRRIVEAFWSDDPRQALMHGPTYMANPLACAAANASLDLFESEPRLAQVAAIATQLAAELAPCRALPNVRDVRVLGAIGVVQLHEINDMAALKSRLLAENIWVRPFRDIVYLTPAFTITEPELTRLTHGIRRALR